MPLTTRTAGFHPLWIALAGLVLLPAVEFAAFFWVAGRIGFLPALLALVATSFVGASLLRRQGGQAVARLLAAFRRGEPPNGAARESFMVALGGVLMIIPGFVSDAIGFALIVPSLLRSLRDGRAVANPVGGPGAGGGSRPDTRRPRADPKGRVIDLDRGEWQSVEDRTTS
jgi:UPF0716 protein FxsA